MASAVSTSESVFAARQARLGEKLQAAGLDALAMVPGASLAYLTGLRYHLVSRPNAALFFPDQPPLFILPELEAGKARELAFPVRILTFGEDPRSWPEAFRQAVETAGLAGKLFGLEPLRMRYLEYDLLQEAAGEARFVSAEAAVAALRMYKDARELEAMRQAAVLAETALEAALPAIRPGVSERQIASELTLQLLRQGSEPELPFFPIVASGPNSANPHATPGDRRLRHGDLLIIDWGATVDGYFSDITRTFAVGEVEENLAEIARVVAEANAAGRAAVRPGVMAAEIDHAARQVIAAAGYGDFFIHRTGHGLGLEGHEPPFIRGDNQEVLQAGMTFTVEPGIYLPGRGGVRIEDDMVVTAEGGESLTGLPRDLAVIG